MLNVLSWLVVLGSSILVLIDAKSIGIQKGQIKGILNMGAVAWFWVCLLFWVVGFPLYLYKRPEYKRINGKASSNTVPTLIGMSFIVLMVVLVTVSFMGVTRISTDDLATQVQVNIEQTWASQPTLKDVSVKSFNLVHKSGNQYQGLLQVTEGGQEEKYVVDVTYDGKTFMWQVEE